MTTGSLMAKSVNATNGIVPIIEGALYQRGTGSAMTEIAEVVEVGKDRMGIPHVRFTMHLMRGDYKNRVHYQNNSEFKKKSFLPQDAEP
jgi:hypothetical protein